VYCGNREIGEKEERAYPCPVLGGVHTTCGGAGRDEGTCHESFRKERGKGPERECYWLVHLVSFAGKRRESDYCLKLGFEEQASLKR